MSGARLFELMGKLVREWMAKLEERFWEHLDAEGTTPREWHLLQQAERLSPKLNSELSLPLYADSESSKDTRSSPCGLNSASHEPI
jgi:hypothetical protein